MLRQRGAAEKYRGPEQVAEDSLVQERERCDIALHEALPGEQIHAAESPYGEIRSRKENQRTR